MEEIKNCLMCKFYVGRIFFRHGWQGELRCDKGEWTMSLPLLESTEKELEELTKKAQSCPMFESLFDEEKG